MSVWVPGQRVDLPSSNERLGAHDRRLGRLERGDIGLWHYATPLLPAPDPDDLIPGTDPYAEPFVNSWLNIPTLTGNYAPLRWRIHPVTKVELEGAIGGGVDGTVAVTLPEPFWPNRDEILVISSALGTLTMTILIDTAGNLIPLGVV